MELACQIEPKWEKETSSVLQVLVEPFHTWGENKSVKKQEWYIFAEMNMTPNFQLQME